ncbi:leucine--tRNA ligase [Candidatus Woesebacteria bacterium]|nr:leucine--tRNA ligase [Candidatus Woesebacteria bacterium]
MKKYDHKRIEKKWQERWEDKGINRPNKMKGAQNTFYNLWMFPYPSAKGLHAGHAFASTGSDVIGRFKRMNGKDVFQPIGYDSFGIHGENYAIKAGKHPMELIKATTKTYERQLKSLGHGYDWTRTVTTSDADYYRWTQWLFIKLFKAGLAYRKEADVNWCPSCKTVLADEQVMTPSQAEKEPKNSKGEKVKDTGDLQVCERCGTIAERKKLNQWFFRITEYADKLLEGLEKIDWPEKIKLAQRNWIGRSEGAIINFPIVGASESVDVFTTRPDTLYGATFFVISPEHPVVEKVLNSEIKVDKEKITELNKYIKTVKSRTSQKQVRSSHVEKSVRDDESEIKSLSDSSKAKTGVFTGLYVINPVNEEKIPVYISDYVLMDYGTGAIMGVPAHDQRDYDFANKYDLPIRKVIDFDIETHSVVLKSSVKKGFIKDVEKKGWSWKKYKDWGYYVVVGQGESGEYIKLVQDKLKNGPWYVHTDGEAKKVIFKSKIFDFKENAKAKKYAESLGIPKEQIDWDDKDKYMFCHDNPGTIINSDEWNGIKVPQNIDKVVKSIETKGWGSGKTSYHLRDWLISRQRYWGPPIPMIYCEKCAGLGKSWFTENSKYENRSTKQIRNSKLEIRNSDDWSSAGWWPVPEEELPVELPFLKDFKPKGGGRGPLADSKEFLSVKCPSCGSKAEREPDVSDTFLDSAWYFLAYPLQRDKIWKKVPSETSGQDAFSNKIIEFWLPVDLYFGGAEHAVLHLMYSRFVTKVLNDLGLIDFDEPFPKFFAHGLMIKDGAKMSKSRGNVVNPDEYIEKYGADTLRLYTMFMGPMDGYPDFRDTGIEGMSRFIDRVWKLYQDGKGKMILEKHSVDILLTKLHQTIKKCTSDIQGYKYNTAIAAIMELVNLMREIIEKSQKQVRVSSTKAKARAGRQITKSVQDDKAYLKNLPALSNDTWNEALEKLTLILAPFAPHFSEEVWCEVLKKDFSVHKAKWPAYDEEIAEEEKVTIAVQINGKLRILLGVKRSVASDKKKVLELVKEEEKITDLLNNKEIEREIFIPEKIVNFVVK